MYMYIVHVHVCACTVASPIQPNPSSSGAEFRYHDVEYVYGQSGGVTIATIIGCRQLTNEGALRKTFELELRIEVDIRHMCACGVSVCVYNNVWRGYDRYTPLVEGCIQIFTWRCLQLHLPQPSL